PAASHRRRPRRPDDGGTAPPRRWCRNRGHRSQEQVRSDTDQLLTRVERSDRTLKEGRSSICWAAPSACPSRMRREPGGGAQSSTEQNDHNYACRACCIIVTFAILHRHL